MARVTGADGLTPAGSRASASGRRAARPRIALAPMWPVPGDDPSAIDDSWLLSPWRDGWRCVAVLDDRVRLRARGGRDLAPLVPSLAEALAPCRPRGRAATVLDVLLLAPQDEPGASEIAEARALEVVDVLCRDGRDLTALDVPTRQGELRALPLRERDGLGRLEAWRGSASAAWEQLRSAGRAGASGLLARRAASPYRPGVRSAEWVAFTELRLEEMLLCGITRGGALVLGMATSHGVAFGGVTWPTRDWSRLAARCREGAPAFPPPAIWPSLGEVAWARPELWVAVTPDVRPASGRGGPRWRFVRVQEDLSP